MKNNWGKRQRVFGPSLLSLYLLLKLMYIFIKAKAVYRGVKQGVGIIQTDSAFPTRVKGSRA